MKTAPVMFTLAIVALLYLAPEATADTDIMDEIRNLDVFKLK